MWQAKGRGTDQGTIFQGQIPFRENNCKVNGEVNIVHPLVRPSPLRMAASLKPPSSKP